MGYAYDNDNIFARILRGEIPNDTVAESEYTLAFRDIQPKAPSHILVIPKGRYVTFDDFAENAPAEEIVDFMRMVAQITKAEGLSTGSGGGGFRAITNAGNDGVQEVPHFHLHIIGGQVIGPMVMLPS
ncbi:MAG: HIT domain-containing protein [Paracoccus sp. (in: a-proteobacteria)]